MITVVALLGRLAAEASEPAPAAQRDAQRQRIYDDVVQVAMHAVARLKAYHTRYGVDLA
ncbi:hypothetical protein ABZ815_51715 [Nonomuraea sp. NPDC047529]|uniref:hypothetical protein n=1 Tax=Nonomuraea sp. NPDC047529 TaxID=3155623 RepID=UPI0033E9AC93